MIQATAKARQQAERRNQKNRSTRQWQLLPPKPRQKGRVKQRSKQNKEHESKSQRTKRGRKKEKKEQQEEQRKKEKKKKKKKEKGTTNQAGKGPMKEPTQPKRLPEQDSP